MVLSVSNNNPGNLRAVGSTEGFQKYQTPQEGLDALKSDLKTKISGSSKAMKAVYGDGYTPSLKSLLNVYAPPQENDTDSYISFVSEKSGIDPDQTLSEADLDKVIPAMIEMEGGKEAVNYFFGNNQNMNPQVEGPINPPADESVIPKIKPLKTIQLPDGNQITLTGQEKPEDLIKLKRKLIEKYSTSVDRKSGAPAAVRAFVGSVYKPEDKLATIQKYYPDALPYGEDNFVFKNPETGKLTLYNPKGLDVGDFASISREGTQLVGGTVGAALGAGAGVFTANPAGVVAGGMAGSGLGVSLSGTAFDKLLDSFGLRVDNRTAREKAVDFGIETAAGAVGEGIGLAVAAGAKAGTKVVVRKAKQVLGGGSKAADDLLKQFQSFGIEPSAALVTGDRGIARLESGLAQNPASAELLMKQASTIVDDTQKAVTKIISQVGEPKTSQGAGEVIKQAAINAAERFNFKQEKLYTEAFDLIGSDTPVKVSAVTKLLEDMEGELARSPKTLDKSLGPAIKYLRNIYADANNPVKSADGLFMPGTRGVPFSALRQIRTAVGRDLADPQLSGSTGSQNEAFKRIYGALTQDLSEAAAGTSAEAAKKLKTADRFTRMWMKTASETMNKINRFDADERAFKFAMSSAKDGGTSLTRLRRHFTEEEWDTVAATVLDKLGSASPGMQNATGDAFSVNSFLTNWNKLSPEAKKALFGGPRYKAQRESLEQLTELLSQIKDVSKFSNTSNTAGALQSSLYLYTLGGGLGASVGYVASGDIEGAAKGTLLGAGSVLTPRMAAKLITSPKFVKWLAEPVEMSLKTGKGIKTSTHMARLSLIAKSEPEIRVELLEYMKALQANTKPYTKPYGTVSFRAKPVENTSAIDTEIADGVYFSPGKSFRENLENIPDEQFKDLEFSMYDAADNYIQKTRDNVNEVLKENGLEIHSFDESRQSKSQYWNIGIKDADDSPLDFNTIKVRFSDHGDFYGGNDIGFFWGDDPNKIAQEIFDKANKALKRTVPKP